MTCVSLMLMLTLALQLGQLTTVAGDDGSAEKTCDLKKISVLRRMDPSGINGIWYPIYRSPVPTYYDGVDLMFYDLKYRSFDDEVTGDASVIVATRKTIYKNGTCESQILAYNAKKPGRATAGYFPYPNAEVLIKYENYILGVDSNAVLFYEAVLINGVVSADYSSLGVMVRDPKKVVKLSRSMRRKLRKFCGRRSFRNISDFRKCQFNYEADCCV